MIEIIEMYHDAGGTELKVNQPTAGQLEGFVYG